MMTSPVRRAALALLMSLPSCGDQLIGPAPTPTLTIEALSPTTLEGVVGTDLTSAPTVVVRRAGHPVAHVAVEFDLPPGAGTLQQAWALTNAAGVATVGSWRLGPTAGRNVLSARIAGSRTTVLFVALSRPDLPYALRSGERAPETNLSPGRAAQPPQIQVIDRFGNGVAGVEVGFAITGGAGFLDQGQQLLVVPTNSSGWAVVSWTLGPLAGRNSIVVTVPGLSSISMVAEAYDSWAVVWDLTSISDVGDDYPSTDFGVVGAQLSLMNFDTCLCQVQRGVFLEEVTRRDEPLGDWEDSSTGTYSANGSALLIGDAPAWIHGDLLVIQRGQRPNGLTLYWVYQRATTTP